MNSKSAYICKKKILSLTDNLIYLTLFSISIKIFIGKKYFELFKASISYKYIIDKLGRLMHNLICIKTVSISKSCYNK